MDQPSHYENVHSTSSVAQSNNTPPSQQPQITQPLQPQAGPQLQPMPVGSVMYVAQPHQLLQFAGYTYPNSQPSPQQQPASAIVYVNPVSQLPPVVHQQFMESYAGHQIFACFVLWCCNWIFGLIAWILAFSAESTKLTNQSEARRLGKASLGLSISGIIVTVIVVAVTLGVVLGGSSKSNDNYCSGTVIYGTCYRYKSYCYGSSYSCCHYSEYYYNGFCYYN